MAKYDERFKLSAVRRYLAQGGGSKTIAASLGIDHSQLRRWAAAYQSHGRAGLAKKCSHYDAQFKLRVLKRAQREGLSDREVAGLYDIRSPGSIAKWRAQYDEHGMGALEPNPKGRKPMPHKPAPEPVSKEMTLEELQKELAYLRAENDYLKKMKALIEAEKTKALVGKRKWSKD
ncbi:IS3 family transposase [Achromobacter piechaudii]|uniref:Transposase n=1 Tax=Achromobacter piechaudii ATCC 43553 TaxID=742159 RepID=D4XJR0_9BURK|nr:IS3 family transposase [Achromobacter piechaudii]EFF72953.1 transposase [Achromobacter piechaudii ATCC 43553]